MTKIAVFAVLALVAGLLKAYDANPAVAQTQAIPAWKVADAPPLDGSSPQWQSILPMFLPTTSQLVTPPMGGGAIERVGVRAVHHDQTLYMMMEWSDSTADETSDSFDSFSDAAAVQFPAVAASSVPAICMGQADQAVNIWQWRADQQSDPPTLPENGYVDSYPSTDDLFFTAREAGNPMSQSEHRVAVQNLVAGGFGTVEVSEQNGLEGNAVYQDGRWMVVFARPFATTSELSPAFGNVNQVDVAFAVWDGSKNERNGLKSVSAFTRLQISAEEPPRRSVAASDDWPAYTPFDPMVPTSIALIVVMFAIVGGLWLYWRPKNDDTKDEVPD